MRAPVVSRVVLTACALSACVLFSATHVIAQQPAPTSQTAQVTPAPAPPRTPIPVKIDVVLQRFKGTNKIGSMPYSLLAVDGTRAMLRLGSSVPVPQGCVGCPTGATYNYTEVGVSIDVQVTPQTDGRYRLVLFIEDSSLGDGMATEAAGLAKLPIIRRYRLDTQVIVRDGQLNEFNVATDKISGETIRAQVTMTVVK